MSNDPKKNPGTYVLKKGLGEPSVDKQLAAWTRDWEHHIMHVLTSYMTAEGRVNQPFLRGVLWTRFRRSGIIPAERLAGEPTSQPAIDWN